MPDGMLKLIPNLYDEDEFFMDLVAGLLYVL